MRITLIRHGQTRGNAENRYIGATDEPLSEAGILSARAVPADAALKTVYVTPLLRARQTAAILYPSAEQIIVPGLREMDFGAFENKSYKDMEHDPDYRAWVESGCTLPCPGGEDMAGFAGRVGAAFQKLLNEHAQETELTVVAHGGTLMAVMTLFAEEQRAYYEWGVKNLEGYTAEAVKGESGLFRLTRVEKINR